MKAFFNKPVVKNILLSVWVLIIGGICSSLGNWDRVNDKWFWIKIVALLFFAVSYMAMLIFYSTNEINNAKVVKLLQHQNKAFEESMIGIISICEQSSQNVNKIIHEIIEEGKINFKIWNFDIGCRLICEKIYNLLCNLHGESKDFAVCYVRLNEKNEKDKEVYMNAFFNQNLSEPSIHKKMRKIDAKNGYHDLKLFQINKSDIEIVMGKEEIQKIFTYETNERRLKNQDKYNQYIAIPIFCSKENGGKMVGLLEIVCLHDTAITNSREELQEIVSKYLVPYAYLLLLLHKLEKALISQPKVTV